MIRDVVVGGADGLALTALEAGEPDRPLVIFLHGFPETKESWRRLMLDVAAAGFHAIAPDQRGYRPSARPTGVAAYDLDRLAADVVAVMDGQGARKAHIVGHDWGALTAWWVASTRPDRVESLIALAAGHPAVWRSAMRDLPAQRRKSSYVAAFQIPLLPELFLRAGDYRALKSALSARKAAEGDPGAIGLSAEDIIAARDAWAAPGVLTAMVNWYRAFWRRSFAPEAAYRVEAPTLLIWGGEDIYGERALADRSLALCAQGRLVILKTTHWVQHDAPEETARLVLEALRDAAAPGGAPEARLRDA